jgi:uncharacterized cysteine cluster protein YcgN (CxxCxxCC family)
MTEKAMQTNQRKAISEVSDSEWEPLCESASIAPFAQRPFSRRRAA